MTRSRIPLEAFGAAVAALAILGSLSGCSGDAMVTPLVQGGGCAQTQSGKIACMFPLEAPDRNHVIRTDAEYDSVFAVACAVPNDYPPRPARGEMLLVAARHWSGCGGCARIRCVEKVSTNQPLVATVEVLHGWGDCDALGTAGAWAIVAEDPAGATFIDEELADAAPGGSHCP